MHDRPGNQREGCEEGGQDYLLVAVILNYVGSRNGYAALKRILEYITIIHHKLLCNNNIVKIKNQVN